MAGGKQLNGAIPGDGSLRRPSSNHHSSNHNHDTYIYTYIGTDAGNDSASATANR